MHGRASEWLIGGGGVVIAIALGIWLKGSFSTRAGPVYREDSPVAFLLTVAVLLFFGIGLVYAGLQ